MVNILVKTYSPGVLATRQTFLDHAKQSGTDALKTASKKRNSKNSRSNWLTVKLLIKLQKSQIHYRLFEGQKWNGKEWPWSRNKKRIYIYKKGHGITDGQRLI